MYSIFLQVEKVWHVFLRHSLITIIVYISATPVLNINAKRNSDGKKWKETAVLFMYKTPKRYADREKLQRRADVWIRPFMTVYLHFRPSIITHALILPRTEASFPQRASASTICNTGRCLACVSLHRDKCITWGCLLHVSCTAAFMLRLSIFCWLLCNYQLPGRVRCCFVHLGCIADRVTFVDNPYYCIIKYP